MRIANDFAARWTVCWATTYTFDPPLFESFLLKRLGDPPLNVAVIADPVKLTQLWASIDLREQWRVKSANRQYLIRAAAISSGAFHAKTTLLANGKDGVLLVGSGNLGLSGVDQGHEVFTRFDSRRPADLPAFRAWRVWITELVRLVDEPLLRSRWADALSQVPWLAGPGGSTTFVTNLDAPLLDSLFGATGKQWAELHLTAPFFDADLRATEALLKRAQPSKVAIYLGRDASVDGPRLLKVLARSGAKATVYAYAPKEYVHAKLVAVVSRGQARVLAGSANLSGPALLEATRTRPTGSRANIEAGVVVDMSADDARNLFVPAGMALEPMAEALVAGLRMSSTPDAPAWPIRLECATFGGDGYVSILARPMPADSALTDGTTFVKLAPNGRSIVKAPSAEIASMVWLVGPDGEPISNRVPLDDRQALDRALSHSSVGSDRPADLDELDLEHPMGRLLAELHQAALFEIDASPAAVRIAQLASADTDTDPAFWERLLRDDLALDPRAARYAGRTWRGDPFPDELDRLLDQMLHKVPSPGLLRLLSGEELTQDAVEAEGRKWTPSQRLATRAYNVLHRWCLAVADPRIRWFSERAPLRHYVALLLAITSIWQQRDWIPEHRLVGLAETLFGAFVRTERTAGYLTRLDDADRQPVLDELQAGPAGPVAAALAFVSLAGASPEDLFAWQPFLGRGLEWGVFAPAEETSQLITSMSEASPAISTVIDRLEFVAAYTDDEHWSERIRQQLGLSELELVPSGNPHYPIELRVGGIADPLSDPHLVELIREALAYKHALGLRLRIGQDLLTIAIGKPIYGRVAGHSIESAQFTPVLLEQLVISGRGLGVAMERLEDTA